MVGSVTSAVVVAGSNNASLGITVEGKFGVAAAQLIAIFGQPFSGYGKNDFTKPLPGINVHAIMRALNDPGAKHTSFRSKGNQFSRIAWLVQAGYSAALNQAFQPPPSGVKFYWTAKDLANYVDSWTVRMNSAGSFNGTAGSSQLTDMGNARNNTESSFRELSSSASLRTTYTYTSDDTVTVTTDQQTRDQGSYAKKQAHDARLGRGMINFA